ncbi:AAA family ATPase [Pseudomonas fluorescens]
MNFQKLSVNNWHALGRIEIDLTRRVTILTGANGSGKTSLLRLLAMHAQWAASDFGVPGEKSVVESPSTQITYKTIGELEYSNGQITNVFVSEQGIRKHLALSKAQIVNSFFVSSHRPPLRYDTPAGIKIDDRPNLKKALDLSRDGQKSAIEGTKENFSASIKSTLFAWLVAGYGVKSSDKYILQPVDECRRYFEGFQSILRIAVPRQFKFESIEVGVGAEVVFVCNGGRDRFILESASGGLAAVIEIAWMLYLQQLNVEGDEEFTAIIDEIENHLHPSIQRTILPDLVAAFPRARFVVSTHSPLVVSSVFEANVYALRFDEWSRANSELLDFKEKARTAAQILDEVLGVTVTVPVWVEEQLAIVVNDYSQRPVTEGIFSDLREELKFRGLEDFLPQTITAVVSQK